MGPSSEGYGGHEFSNFPQPQTPAFMHVEINIKQYTENRKKEKKRKAWFYYPLLPPSLLIKRDRWANRIVFNSNRLINSHEN